MMYLNTPYKITYDTTKYPFRNIVSQMLGLTDKKQQLEDLHLFKTV